MSSLNATRQHFIQEITQQIPSGRWGLAVIDHGTFSHVLVTHHGQVVVFGQGLTLLDPVAVQTGDEVRVTVLDNLGLDDLATILDSFADPDSGSVVVPAALEASNERLPAYFQARLAEDSQWVTRAQAALAA